MNPPILLEVRNSNGSVEHYYHFLLGFLAPILLQPTAELSDAQLIRSCGPMDDHVRALNLPQLTIVPKDEMISLRTEQARPVRVLRGMDSPGDFDGPALLRFRALVLERLAIEEEADPRRLLMIGRGRSPDFYQSTASEVKSSADLRRSIPNMAEIKARIEAAGQPVAYTELETATFASQVAMFAGANTVIAQHGAALVNILWMKPGGTVVEINPKLGGTGEFAPAFEKLSACCGHRHVSLPQKSPHAPVDPALVLDALRGVAG